MKVLVTGATGFVGQVLCSQLTRRGHEVRGSACEISRVALPAVTVKVAEIGPTTDWTAAVDGVDAVVHLAARAHILRDRAADALAEYRRTNVEGTRSLAAASRRAGVGRLVFLSSAKVYGERSARPFTEGVLPHPEDAYAVSKLEAEEALKDALASGHTKWTILRPPLVYGPGVRANFLQLMRAVARGMPLPLARIDNRRSLVYVGNLVDAIEACLEAEAAAGRTWPVSDGEDLSTPELVRRLARALNRPARLVPVPIPLLRLAGALSGRAATVDRLVESLQVDATAIRVALPWTPSYSLDQGLLETARWFRTVQA